MWLRVGTWAPKKIEVKKMAHVGKDKAFDHVEKMVIAVNGNSDLSTALSVPNATPVTHTLDLATRQVQVENKNRYNSIDLIGNLRVSIVSTADLADGGNYDTLKPGESRTFNVSGTGQLSVFLRSEDATACRAYIQEARS